MEINHLREFMMLAQTENFLEAADRLFISQSTLSKHIKSIEIELGVPLFHRSTRRVQLSRYGEIVLPYAKQMTALQQACADSLLAHIEREQDTLNIGSIPALAPYNITEILVSFKKHHRNIKLNVIQAATPELKELLRSGGCELAFLREIEPERDGLVRIPYDADCLAAVLPKGHPCAGDGEIPLEKLKNEELLMIGRNTMLYDIACSACVQSGFQPKVAFTDHKVEHLIDFVQKGMGTALLMKRLAMFHGNDNVVITDLKPTVTTTIQLCHRKDAALSEAARNFLKCVKKHKCGSACRGGTAG